LERSGKKLRLGGANKSWVSVNKNYCLGTVFSSTVSVGSGKLIKIQIHLFYVGTVFSLADSVGSGKLIKILIHLS